MRAVRLGIVLDVQCVRSRRPCRDDGSRLRTGAGGRHPFGDVRRCYGRRSVADDRTSPGGAGDSAKFPNARTAATRGRHLYLRNTHLDISSFVKAVSCGLMPADRRCRWCLPEGHNRTLGVLASAPTEAGALRCLLTVDGAGT